MSGLRIGERLLQIGVDDPKLLAAMASKVGLSGSASVVVPDETSAARARDAAAEAGALVDVHAAPAGGSLPFAGDAFDVVVVHAMSGAPRTAAALADARRVLRHGGRIILIEAGPKSGLAALLRPHRPDAPYEAAGGPVAALKGAGFRPVRILSERDGYRFTEGLKA
jgi:SAM-dependent methyltransferase